MTGLKSYVPVLAGYLSMTPDALYERQRKLVRAGLIVGTAGRGPGSGARVTPPVVSLLVIAVLAADDLADIDAVVRKLADQRSDAGRCPLTGNSTFGDALALVFASESIASSVREIKVRRSALHGEIVFQRRGRKAWDGSSFGRPRRAHDDPSRHRLEIEARLPGEAVQAISKDLAAIASGKRLKLPQEN
jgi:hypothetical protein